MRPKREVLSKEVLISRGIPKRFLNTTLEDFETYDESLKQVKKTISKYIKSMSETLENGQGLYIYGSNGVGKTMLACVIVREAYINRYTSKRLTMQEYLAKQVDVWNCKNREDKEEMEDRLYDIKSADFLVLEELGKEGMKSETVLPVIEDLFRYREEKGLCTIICTNLNVEDILSKYSNSSSIESLLRGSMLPIRIVGKDRRVYNV